MLQKAIEQAQEGDFSIVVVERKAREIEAEDILNNPKWEEINVDGIMIQIVTTQLQDKYRWGYIPQNQAIYE